MDEAKLTRRQSRQQAKLFTTKYIVSLVEEEGKHSGRSHALTGERVTIGRSSEAHVAIDDDMSSRFHAVLTLLPTGYELRDLHSTNGTLVNDAKVEAHAMAHGDSIRIGKTVLRYLIEPREDQGSRVYEI